MPSLGFYKVEVHLFVVISVKLFVLVDEFDSDIMSLVYVLILILDAALVVLDAVLLKIMVLELPFPRHILIGIIL